MAPTKNFPPDPKFIAGEGGGNNYWINACGIDDLNADGCGVTKVSFMVMTDSIKGSKYISVRYYFNASEIANIDSVKASELYDQAAVEAAPADGVITGIHKYDKLADTYYVEIKFDDYKIANSAKKYQFTVGMYYGDTWDPTNDTSYEGLKIFTEDDAFFGTGNEVKAEGICIYDGDVHVGGVEPDGSLPVVPEPTDPPTETPTEAPTEAPTEKPTSGGNPGGSAVTLAGDANCDDAVTMADAAAIFQSIGNADKYALSEQGSANADVDGKKGITASDAITIQKFTAKLISSLPIK
jgi:hypothetical protein